MNQAKLSENTTGAFGVQLTLRDFYQFAKFWLDCGKPILSKKTYQLILQPNLEYGHAKNFDSYGLGFRIRRINQSIQTLFHVGGANRMMAWFQLFPAKKTAIFYLSSPPKVGGSMMYRIPLLQKKLAEFAGVLSEYGPKLFTFEEDMFSAIDLSALVGRFKSSRSGRIVDIKPAKKKPQLLFLKPYKELLIPYAARKIRSDTKWLVYDAILDSKQTVVALATVNDFFERIQ